MTNLETRYIEVATHALPKIAKELEKANRLKALELRLKFSRKEDYGPALDELDNWLAAEH